MNNETEYDCFACRVTLRIWIGAIDPRRVLDFLDVAGTWDPTLLFVLGGAVGVTIVAFRFVLRQSSPFAAPVFQLPTKNDIDRPLLVGSALFGVGWGIAGYCPGPGITSLILGSWNPILFVLAMVMGSFLYIRLADWSSKLLQAHVRTLARWPG